MPKFEIRNGARLAIAVGLGLTLALGSTPAVAIADAESVHNETEMDTGNAGASPSAEDSSVDGAATDGDTEEGGVAKIDDVPYTSFADAVSHVQAGQTITLLADAQTDPVCIEEGVTVDLGGHTLSLVGKTKPDEAGITFASGSSTLKNGKVLDTCKVANSFAVVVSGNDTELVTEDVTITVQVPASGAGYGIRVINSAEATFNSGTIVNSVKAIESDKGYIYGVTVYGTGKGAMFDEATATKLTVNEGVTIDAYAFAISGNGKGTLDNTLITINGGTLRSEAGPAVYHPQYGKIVINGGTLDGLSGIEIRAGELEVNGGIIKGDNEKTIVYEKDAIG